MTVALFYHPLCLEHETGEHPERPARLTAIQQALAAAGYTQTPGLQTPRLATEEEVTRVHSQAHLQRVARAAAQGWAMLDPDTLIPMKLGSHDTEEVMWDLYEALGKFLQANHQRMLQQQAASFCRLVCCNVGNSWRNALHGIPMPESVPGDD